MTLKILAASLTIATLTFAGCGEEGDADDNNSGGGGNSEICDNGSDDDGDGAIDCDDSDCNAAPACAVNPPTYTADIQPILQAKCTPCHTSGSSGGTSFANNYADNLNSATSCPGQTIYQCILQRIQNGTMPPARGCSGDPATDAGNASCLTASEQTLLQEWVTAGAPQ